MPISVLMPALSPTMEAGTLAKWHVKEGDNVNSGDIIAEIETDKATMEVEAVDEGTIGKILIAEGTAEVKVNEPIALILEDGEDSSALDNITAQPQHKPEVTEPAANPANGNGQVVSSVRQEVASSANGSTAAQNIAVTNMAMVSSSSGGSRIFASPLARRIAKQNNIDIALVSGTGPSGRIVKADIEQAVKNGVNVASQSSGTSLAAGISDNEIAAIYPEGSYEVIPHDVMRKTIAARLTESKQTVPHFYLSIDCELDRLLDLRKQINDKSPKDGPQSYKISVNDFIIKAMAMALQKVPGANVTWTSTGLFQHRASDVGVAVAIEGGLFTPIIRNAETKGLAGISAEMKDLAARARARKLMPEEYQGGTTAISNLGMYGIDKFNAIINPPQATILAVGTGQKKAVVDISGNIKAATVMNATLSCDHRAVDGALGAELLNAFKACIDEPAMMLV